MKFFDGMEAIVEEKGKTYLYIATRPSRAIDRLTMGFFPKPNYEQVGVYIGNTDGIKEGAIVKVYFRKNRKWKDIFKEMSLIQALKEITRSDNIERVELVRQGNVESNWQSFKQFWKI